MFDLIASVLAWFYSVIPSYGFAVAGLTLAVMVVVTPLTLKSTRSMLQMQRLQPELKAIQGKYKDDRPKMNEELMAFYQENGINPLGGCLPMVIQLPVFLVLFRVVRGITRRATDVGNQLGWSAGRLGVGAESEVSKIGGNERSFDPQDLPVDSEMFSDLTGRELDFDDRPTEMVSWGIDLARSAQDVLGDSIIDSLPYLLLIGVVLVSSIYQQRQIRGRNSGAPVNPQQEMIMKILPFMLPVFSFTMPAALVVYFVISNLYRIGQQGYITRSLYKGEDSLGALAARSREVSRGDGSGSKGGGGRTTPKKGQSTPKRGSAPAKGSDKKGSDKKGSGSKGSASKRGSGSKKAGSRTKKTGAGRTGNAPTRQNRSGGRTTDPGSPQHKKRKK